MADLAEGGKGCIEALLSGKNCLLVVAGPLVMCGGQVAIVGGPGTSFVAGTWGWRWPGPELGEWAGQVTASCRVLVCCCAPPFFVVVVPHLYFHIM
jgi:hypothetical protein